MKSLIDSNVLIRAIDPRPSPFSVEAVRVLRRLAHDGSGVLSAQSLSEFAFHALVKQKLEPRWVLAQVGRLTTVFPVLPLTGEAVIRALAVMSRQPLSYLDAQVWATARLNGVGQVITEGLHWHKQVRERVLFHDLLRQVPTFGWILKQWAADGTEEVGHDWLEELAEGWLEDYSEELAEEAREAWKEDPTTDPPDDSGNAWWKEPA